MRMVGSGSRMICALPNRFPIGLFGKQISNKRPITKHFFGLSSICSVTGYHMAVVAGIVFFTIRALLALMSTLSSRHPIKKWAAIGALAAAAFYLLLSGAEVATQRSFIMIAIVL